MSFSTSILTGVFTALKASAPLAALLTAPGRPVSSAPPIYPVQAPPDSPLPHVTFNEAGAVAFDTSDSFGREVTLDVHAWSSSSSPLEAYQILAEVEAALQDANLTMTTGDLVLIRLASVRCDVDADGTFHGVATFRALISQ